MIYYVYLRTFYTLWEKKKECTTLEQVNNFLDNVTDYTDYMVMGYDENKEPYNDYGKIDKPLVKRLKH